LNIGRRLPPAWAAGPHLCEQQQPGVGSGLSTVADIALYNTSSPLSSDFKQYNGRLDADVTGRDHASFAIYWVPDTKTNYNGGLGYDLFNHAQINDAFSIIWNHPKNGSHSAKRAQVRATSWVGGG